MSKKKVSALDMPDVSMGKLPEHLNLQRTRVLCKADAPIHKVFGTLELTHRWELTTATLRLKFVRLTEDEIEFDMIGIDAALANAFRRILIAEVPTMAIEKILMVNNTSVIPDEVLAHRLGLIPLDADPRVFEYLSENDVPNERNTIVYKLDVSCKKGSPCITVKSDKLKWLPNGSELEIATLDKSSKSKSYT